jgi:cholesterol transport system auxiliary component
MALCALALAGCVSLLPIEKPVNLYRFEPAFPAAPAPSTNRSIIVLLSNGAFNREAAGDRLIAVKNGGVAYVASARWVVPAEILFRQAVAQSFQVGAGPVRLLQRGEPGNPDYVLALDVTRFEVRYETSTSPTVRVSFHAVLTRARDRGVVGEDTFAADVASSEDRVSAFIPAYDAALSKTLTKLSQWVSSRVVA